MNDSIISALDVMRRHAVQESNVFRARAYAKVIAAIKEKDSEITSIDDIKDIPGVGKGIKEKISELLTTGHLAKADEIANNRSLNITEALLNIHGIGPAKAKELVRSQGISSIAMLRNAVESGHVKLNAKQKIGLKYYEDLLKRIPRNEMFEHEQILKHAFRDYECSVVGSFRRGAQDSGDIDLLVKTEEPLPEIIQGLRHSGYIVETLAEGPKKFMGIVKLGNSVRRLDVLYTPEKEYGYAILYFTGSDKFNVGMRKYALTKGWSLNEKSLTYVGTKKTPPRLKTEEDIFVFLEVPFVPPTQRRVFPKNIR